MNNMNNMILGALTTKPVVLLNGIIAATPDPAQALG